MDRIRDRTELASAGARPAKAEKQEEATPPTAPDQEFMKEEEAAALLNLSIRTLQGYRHKGGGPRYHKFGRSVRYARVDLLGWARAKRRRSTSDGALPQDSTTARTSPAPEDSTPTDAVLRSAT